MSKAIVPTLFLVFLEMSLYNRLFFISDRGQLDWPVVYGSYPKCDERPLEDCRQGSDITFVFSGASLLSFLLGWWK